MKNFKFKWLLLSIILSIASINTAWAASYTFSSGKTIYYDFTAISGAGNYGTTSFYNYDNYQTYDASLGGKVIDHTYGTNFTVYDDQYLFKTETGGWTHVNYNKYPSSGQNAIKVGADGKSYTWGTYAPPISSIAFSHNATTFGGDGSEGNPYIVLTGTSITVTATATKSVNDADASINYKWGTGSYGNTNTTTLNCSSSGTHTATVTCKTVVSSTSSTESSKTIYFSATPARTFKSGKKIYFQDYSSTMSTLGGSIHWKTTDGNVYAKFYDGSSWTRSSNGALVSGSWEGDNAIYEIDVPGSDKTFTKVVFYRGDKNDNTSEWNLTTEQTPPTGYNLFTIADKKSGDYWIGSWGKYAHNAALLGAFNDWDPCEGMFPTDGTIRVIVNLSAETTYKFTILKGSTYYACSECGALTGTTENQQAYSGQSDFSLTTEEAGEYWFHWDNTNNRISVYYPKSRLKKQTYLYLNVTNETYWNKAGTTPFLAKFYIKYYDSGSDLDDMPLTCSTPLEDYVYYVVIPNSDYAGQVQLERWVNSAQDGRTYVSHAYNRTSSAQNCLKEETGKEDYMDYWTPAWTTYCPPKETSTITNHGTVTYGGNGGSSTPYLVEKGDKIKVQAGSSDYIEDGNMTTTYHFYNDDSSLGSDQTSADFEFDASEDANVTYEMNVNSFNAYNSATSSDKYSTKLYYKTVTCYTVTYDANDADDGTIPAVSGTKYASGATVTVATNSGTLTRTGYSFAGWNTEPDGSGITYIAGTGTFNISDDVTLYAEWTPVALTFSTAGNWEDKDNWSPKCVPTSGHNVTISANVTVNDAEKTAYANTVTIAGGKLTIGTTGKLVVTDAITNGTAANLVIETDGSNQGALIFNSTGTTQAQVKMYSKAASGTFQYMAIPLTSLSVNPTFAATGTYTFVWHEGTGWERRGYYTDLAAFEPIGLSQSSATTYTMEGALASTANKAITLASTSESTYQGMNMIGNSWTAPISIAALKTALDHEKVTETVYIYCTGSGNSSSTTETAGQWLAIPIDASGWSGWGGLKVIPAMQAFLIKATAATSVTLNYTDMVRAVESANMNQPLRAPKREAEEDITLTTLRVADSRTHTDLNLFEGEKFTNAFDNGWEATFMVGDGSSAQFYAMSDLEKMAVLATPNLEGTVVGFKPGQEAEYTISFIGNEAGYYLNDVKTAKSTLISEGNTYEFTSDGSDQSARFVISKIPMQPTGVEEVIEGANARKQMVDGILYIIRDGRMYNAEGSLVK